MTKNQLKYYKIKLKKTNVFRYTIGNHKVGTDTLIFNLGAASDCPSRARGLCQVPPGRCYALKAERYYPQSLPFRRAQARYWKSSSAEKISRDIRIALKKHKAIKYIRVNESGDFYGVRDVKKLCRVAAWVPAVSFYAYTARRDLINQSTITPANLILTGSGFMLGNNFSYDHPAAPYECPGNCRTCNLCKTAGGHLIRVKPH